MSKQSLWLVLCLLGTMSTEMKEVKKSNHPPQCEGLWKPMSQSLCPCWRNRDIKTRNEGFTDFRRLLNMTQRAAFPGDARSTTGTEAIAHQYLLKRNLFRYFTLFFTNLLHKIHCVKGSSPNSVHILRGGELIRNSNQELLKTPAFWPNGKINLSGLN